MKRADGSLPERDIMRSHYDFSRGVQGKYRHFIGQTYTRKIHHADGTITAEQVEPAEGVVFLAPDVQEYFSNSESVNKALRGLIELIRQTRLEKTPDESG
ncbi:MAG: hypothetical protein KGZ35_07415 [Truepera sp.]|nr:hypothetical protein [Truepera sp.]